MTPEVIVRQEQHVDWLVDILTKAKDRDVNGHKGVRLKQVLKEHNNAFTTPEEWLIRAVNRAVSQKKVLALVVGNALVGNPFNRKSSVRTVYPADRVHMDDHIMLYLPGHVPYRVLSRLRGVRRRTERALRIIRNAKIAKHKAARKSAS